MAKKKKVKPKKKKPIRRLNKTGKAEQMNIYRRKLQEIAIASGALDVFQLIPEREIKAMLEARLRSMRVVAAKGQVIPTELLRDAKNAFSVYLPKLCFSIVPDGPKMSLHDYLTAGLTLYSHIKMLEGDEYETAPEVKKGFAAFMAMEKESRIFLYALARQLIARFSKIDSCFYWFYFYPVLKQEGASIYSSCLEVNKVPAQVKHVQLDGRNRPVYRIGRGTVDKGFYWATVYPSGLKIAGVLSEMPLQVYAQAHALVRLRERIDCEREEFMHYFLFDAFENLEVHTNAMGKILVAYRLYGKKVGYLVVTIESGIAIIRTFLFLTNSGTPEGEKLHAQFGLVAQEKKYLKIGKLSTFALSDLREDERLRTLFTEAGCGSLFELTAASSEGDPVNQHAGSIAKYLGLD